MPLYYIIHFPNTVFYQKKLGYITERHRKRHPHQSLVTSKFHPFIITHTFPLNTVFDQKKLGYITSEDLRYIMMNRGEKMSAEEADEMVRDADIDGDGKIDYEGN